MNITPELNSEYEYDETANVWLNKNTPPFHYSDGDRTETEIGEILRSVNDRSVLSDELKQQLKNWPTVYYFSANRSNLLRPFESTILKSARVLELGCGMGAITRYLGETAKEVIAVEGSPRRGSIAAIRCQDLTNTHIVIDEIKNLPPALGKFDVVTLIGVLEYARRYGGPGAEIEVLKKARSFLKPDGALIVAIENKLGLKYWGGVPEDHLQRSWVGLTNGYSENGVCTWSRKELVNLLSQSGFTHCEQFLALPDYKLPTTIITPRGLAAEPAELDLAPLLNNNSRVFERLPIFNAGEAWESIYQAGLVADMADSLCFIATMEKNPSELFENDKLVIHYGDLGSLPKKYAKETAIRKTDNTLAVTRSKLDAESGSPNDAFYQELKDEPYYKGEFLFSKIRKIAMRPDWTLEEFFAAFKPWSDALIANADSEWNCDGNLIDFTPFNIFIENGEVKPFDLEWVARKRLPLPYLLYRGLFNTVMRMLPLRKSTSHNIGNSTELFQEFIKTLHLPDSLPISNDYLWWQELKFMRSIRGKQKFMFPKEFRIAYMH